MMGNVQSVGASNEEPTQETGILECLNVSTGCCSRGSGFGQSERHVRKGFSHGLFSTSGSDAKPMPQGAPSPLRVQNGPGILRRGATRVLESDEPQSTSNAHDSNAVQFATRPRELLQHLEWKKREERKKAHRPPVQPAIKVFDEANKQSNLSCRRSMQKTGIETFVQRKEALKETHAFRKIGMLVESNNDWEETRRERVMAADDFSPNNWQVRRSGTEPTKKCVEGDIATSVMISPALQQERGLTANGHLQMRMSIKPGEQEGLVMQMLERETPVTEAFPAEKSLLEMDEVAESLFKDSPEALYDYKMHKLTEEFLATSKTGSTTEANGNKKPHKSTRQRTPKSDPHHKEKADRRDPHHKDTADRFLGNSHDVREQKVAQSPSGSPLTLKSSVNYVV